MMIFHLFEQKEGVIWHDDLRAREREQKQKRITNSASNAKNNNLFLGQTLLKPSIL